MVNKVIIVGNLGKDPEVKFTSGGKAVCNFPVATSERWTDQDGQKQERTEWHSCEIWGKQAETCGQYLAKGRQVYVEGSLRTDKYDDKEGITRYRTKVVARDVRFLGGKGDGGQAGGSAQGGGGDTYGPEGEDDIPFVSPFWQRLERDVA